MRRFTILVFLLALCGCAGIDQDQARLCRIALPALHPPGASIEITGIERGATVHSVIIRHEVARPPSPPRERQSECRFGGGPLSLARLDLVDLKLDGRPLTGASLQFLKRFWIDEPGVAALQPPLSAAERADVPKIPAFLAVPMQHVVLALPQIAIYALLAPAFALVYGLIGRINLAFGELVVVGGQGALLGMVLGGLWSGGSPAAMLGCSIVLGLAAGATHAEAIARGVVGPLAREGGQPLLVATAGLSAALLEYVRLAQGSGPRWTPPLLGTPVFLADGGGFVVTVTRGALVFAILAMCAGLALLAVMRASSFGRAWRATAEEPVAAALMGIDTGAVLVKAVMIGGLMAGLAGFIVTAHYGGVGFAGGLGIGLKALIAAILGGIGSVGGAMAGAVVLGAFEAAWAAFLPLHLREGAVFGLLVLLLMFRPGGLFGYAGRDAGRDGGLR